MRVTVWVPPIGSVPPTGHESTYACANEHSRLMSSFVLKNYCTVLSSCQVLRYGSRYIEAYSYESLLYRQVVVL